MQIDHRRKNKILFLKINYVRIKYSEFHKNKI